MEKIPQMDEFTIISEFFLKNKGKRPDVLLGIGDDCALLQAPNTQNLAISNDTLILNRHFLPNTPAQAIGNKALAVSLSDLASMGAEPAWLMLSLTLPEADAQWLAGFSSGLFALADQYNISLVGGNTSQGPLNISTTLLGFIPPHNVLRRSTANPGDDIYVTGFLGNGGLALQVLLDNFSSKTLDKNQANQLLFYPPSRIKMGIALRTIASAAIDISDGLAADLQHILDQSKVGATIFTSKIPLSPFMKELSNQQALELALGSGDDYELCFTAQPIYREAIQDLAKQQACPCKIIGQIETPAGLNILTDDGKVFDLPITGYNHFNSRMKNSEPL